MFLVSEVITINVYVGTSSQTVPYVVYDEANGSFDTGNMSEVGSTGIYTQTFTPDAAGYWTFACAVAALGFRYGAMYPVEVGQINELMDDWADGGRLDLILDARAPANEYDTQLDANVSTRAASGEYDTEMGYITAAVALASVLGALADAAAQDGDATDKTVQSLVKGLHDVLWDADGVVAFPASAAPANGVSLAEVIRAIYDDSNILQTEWADAGRLDAILDARAPAGEYDTQLDANMSTRAPSSEYDTEMAYVTEAVATEAKQDIIDTNVDDIETDTNEIQLSLADGGFTNLILDIIAADVVDTKEGKLQVFEKSITAALNAGVTTVATITTQPCIIESIVVHADTAPHTDMTTCAVEGGVDQVVTFIGVADAIEANLDAADKQVGWTGIVRLAATKTITIDLQGVGATAADLTIIIGYRASVDGGYLV